MRSQAYAGNLAAQNAERALAALDERDESHHVNRHQWDTGTRSHSGNGSLEGDGRSIGRSQAESIRKTTARTPWNLDGAYINPGAPFITPGPPVERNQNEEEEIVGDSEVERQEEAERQKTRAVSEPASVRSVGRPQTSLSRTGGKVVHAHSSEEDEPSQYHKKRRQGGSKHRQVATPHDKSATLTGGHGRDQARRQAKVTEISSLRQHTGSSKHPFQGTSSLLKTSVAESQPSQSSGKRRDMAARLPPPQEELEAVVYDSQEVVPETQLSAEEALAYSPKLEYERSFAASEAAAAENERPRTPARAIARNEDAGAFADISTQGSEPQGTESQSKVRHLS
jgi:hypothetical protein